MAGRPLSLASTLPLIRKMYTTTPNKKANQLESAPGDDCRQTNVFRLKNKLCFLPNESVWLTGGFLKDTESIF